METILLSAKGGPLSLLRHALRDGARVSVVLRRRHAMGGVASGVLLAFDRHMNLVLGGGVTVVGANGSKRETRQMLVRGDSVICVTRREE